MGSLWDSLTSAYNSVSDTASKVGAGFVDAFTNNAANITDGVVNAATAALGNAINGNQVDYVQEKTFMQQYGGAVMIGGAALLAVMLLRRK